MSNSTLATLCSLALLALVPSGTAAVVLATDELDGTRYIIDCGALDASSALEGVGCVVTTSVQSPDREGRDPLSSALQADVVPDQDDDALLFVVIGGAVGAALMAAATGIRKWFDRRASGSGASKSAVILLAHRPGGTRTHVLGSLDVVQKWLEEQAKPIDPGAAGGEEAAEVKLVGR